MACLRDSLWHILWVESDPDSSYATPGSSSAAQQSSSRGPVARRSPARSRSCTTGTAGSGSFPRPFHRDGVSRGKPRERRRGGGVSRRGGENREADARAKELLRRARQPRPLRRARVRWFKAEVLRDREEHAGRGRMVESWGLAPEHHIQINRGRVFDDALAALGPAVLSGDQATWRREHPDERPPGSLKGIVRVQFTNEHGVEEAGVDGGGLFKDFLNDLIAGGV